MLAGNLRDRIEIFKAVTTKDDFSGSVVSYTLDFPTRAEVSFLSGSESYDNFTEAAKKMKFRVRFKKNKYNEEQMIKWRDEYYNIRSINPDRHRMFLIIEAEREPGTIKLS